MPLEPTGRREAGETSIASAVNSLDVGFNRDRVPNSGIRTGQKFISGTRARSRFKNTKRLAAVLLVAVTVAGCADGLATDAERAKQADATRESVLTDLQATQTWNLVHGTPESTPTTGEE